MFEFDDLEELEAQQEGGTSRGEQGGAPSPAPGSAPTAHVAACASGLSGAAAAAQRAADDLQSEDAGLRWEACRELAKLCAVALAYTPALEALTQDPDDDVRRAGKKALRELRGDSASQQPSAQVVGDVLAMQERRTVSAVLAAAVAAGAPPAQPVADVAKYEIKEYQVRRPDKATRAKRGDGPAFLRLLQRQDQAGAAEASQGGAAGPEARRSSKEERVQGGDAEPLGASHRDPNRGAYREPVRERDPFRDPPSEPAEDDGGGGAEEGVAKQASLSAKPEAASKSWLEGRGRKTPASLLPAVPSEEELPVDPLRLNFKIFKSKKHVELWAMRVERERMTPAEICEIWEKSWGVTYASRVRMEAAPGSATKWLHPQEGTVPCSPAVVRLDAGGSILYTLAAALQQYGPLSLEEGFAAKEKRQTDATLSASSRADADRREVARFAKLPAKQRTDNRQRR